MEPTISAVTTQKSTGLAQAMAATEHIYAKVRNLIPEVEWAAYAPLIVEIERLKREPHCRLALEPLDFDLRWAPPTPPLG